MSAQYKSVPQHGRRKGRTNRGVIFAEVYWTSNPLADRCKVIEVPKLEAEQKRIQDRVKHQKCWACSGKNDSLKMLAPSKTVVQHGRRKGANRNVIPAEVNIKLDPPADHCTVTVLPTSEQKQILDSATHQMFSTHSGKNDSLKVSVPTEPVVQHGQRKGTSQNVTPSAELHIKPDPPVDLQEVLMLSDLEWRRILDNVNRVNKAQEHLIASAREREDLYHRSKEAVKTWTNTIVAQHKKKLEEKKIRKEVEEEKKKQIDIEEAKFQEQKRKEAIEQAKNAHFCEMDRVRKFHSAVLMTEVLKEREAQIEMKKRIENAMKDIDNQILDIIRHNEVQALQQEMLKGLEKKQLCLENSESLKQQMKEYQEATEKDRIEQKEIEVKELEQIQKLCIEQEITRKQKKQEEERNIMKTHQEHLTMKKIIKAGEVEKENYEEERRKRFVKDKDKRVKLWKEKQVENFRRVQSYKDALGEKLAAYYHEHTITEDKLIAKAASEAAEFQAKQDKQQHEKDEKKAAMLKSIADHRIVVQNELEDKKQKEKQNAMEMLNEKKAADISFHQEQLVKAQKRKEAAKMLLDTHVHQMAEKHAQEQRIENEKQEFAARNAEAILEDENKFQNYAKHVIQAAKEAQRKTFLLCKVAKEGVGGGHGPAHGGIKPSYQAQDEAGTELLSYVCSRTTGIKELNEYIDIKDSKNRLGLIW